MDKAKKKKCSDDGERSLHKLELGISMNRILLDFEMRDAEAPTRLGSPYSTPKQSFSREGTIVGLVAGYCPSPLADSQVHLRITGRPT